MEQQATTSQQTPQHKTSFIQRLRQRGQGMTEYIIIVGVIAVSAIGVFGYFGDTIQNQVAGMSAELSGGDGATQQGAAVKSAGKGAKAAKTHKDLSNYHKNGNGKAAG